MKFPNFKSVFSFTNFLLINYMFLSLSLSLSHLQSLTKTYVIEAVDSSPSPTYVTASFRASETVTTFQGIERMLCNFFIFTPSNQKHNFCPVNQLFFNLFLLVYLIRFDFDYFDLA